jgi:hypothetical protein
LVAGRKDSGRAYKPDSPVNAETTEVLLNQEQGAVNNVSFGIAGRICVTRALQFLSQKLFQFGVFGFGGNKDGNVGVGVFPECQKILIGRLGLGGVALQDVGAGKAKMG